jgi:3-methyladenine DNA glycosylase/8-oxoguanine DNA glycosylase
VRSEAELTCAEVAEQLSAAPDGTLSLDPAARRHVEHCLRCQAEAAQYRRLLRMLRSMRAEPARPAPGLLGDLLDALDGSSARRSGLTGRRAAYVGGLAAATAAGVGGAIVLANRTRRRLPLAG